MRRRIWGERSTPMRVITTLAARPKATVVWMARPMSSWSPAPMDIPLRKPMSMKMRLPEELTAARALLPRKLPTMRESAVLYIC